MLEVSVFGKRRLTTETITDLKRIRSGQMIASFNLEVYGAFFVRQMLVIRRNNDILFIRGSDYPDPRGPRAYHRFFYISDAYENHLLSCILPTIAANIEAEGCLDMMDEFLLNEQPIIQPIGPVDLSAISASVESRQLVRAGKLRLLPEPLKEIVGFVHFNIAELCSIWECPIVLDRGLFFVKSPYDLGSAARPVAIEGLMRQEMTIAVRNRLAELAIHGVPTYLQASVRRLSSLAPEFETALHDRLSLVYHG